MLAAADVARFFFSSIHFDDPAQYTATKDAT
jgi:hypothetical protein